jgi:hypothetical protein
MSKVSFLTVEEFKSQVGATSLSVLKNPKTGKLFMSAGGDTYRVQGDIKQSEEIRVLIPEEGISEACLVNVSGGAEEQFSL